MAKRSVPSRHFTKNNISEMLDKGHIISLLMPYRFLAGSSLTLAFDGGMSCILSSQLLPLFFSIGYLHTFPISINPPMSCITVIGIK